MEVFHGSLAQMEPLILHLKMNLKIKLTFSLSVPMFARISTWAASSLFDSIKVGIIIEFISSAVARICKLRTAKLLELEVPSRNF